jgi:uncharacterized protein (DUF2147 family)
MMRIIPVLAAAMLLPQPTFANALSDACGVWIRDDGNAHVRIAPCGQLLCATNLWIGDTSKGEEVGDRLIMTLRPTSEKTLDGEAYDPKRKLTYSMTLHVTLDGLTTQGCIARGLLCKNASWTQAKE